MGTLTYSYGAAGHVINKAGTLAAGTLPAAVSGDAFNADNATTTFHGAALSHDANGNLINDGANTYTWDARNHLSTINGGVSASFVYDPFGRRTEKVTGGTTTRFVYDGLNPVQELDGTNPGNPTTSLLTGLRIDEYFQRTDSNGAMAFLTDALGSTIGLTNSARSLATNYTYQPFGATTMGVGLPTPIPTNSPAARTMGPVSTTTGPDTTTQQQTGSSAKTRLGSWPDQTSMHTWEGIHLGIETRSD